MAAFKANGTGRALQNFGLGQASPYHMKLSRRITGQVYCSVMSVVRARFCYR